VGANVNGWKTLGAYKAIVAILRQENLALASMARDDSPASSTAPASCTAAAAAQRPMRGKVGSEFQT